MVKKYKKGVHPIFTLSKYLAEKDYVFKITINFTQARSNSLEDGYKIFKHQPQNIASRHDAFAISNEIFRYNNK